MDANTVTNISMSPVYVQRQTSYFKHIFSEVITILQHRWHSITNLMNHLKNLLIFQIDMTELL